MTRWLISLSPKSLLRSLAAPLLVIVLAVGCGASETADQTELEPIVVPALDRRSEGSPALVVTTPADGEVVTSPVRVRAQVDNFALAAKGVSKDGEGHLHVVVDEPCIEAGEVIADDYVHVGSGAATTEVELEPGEHTLCVQLGDGFHTALAITKTIRVTVEG